MKKNNSFVKIKKSRNMFSKTLISAALTTALLSGCGGSSGTDDYAQPALSGANNSSQSLMGSAVKGPIINADVTVYALDLNAEDLRGAIVATGSTNELAQFSDIIIESGNDNEAFFDSYFIVEVSNGTVITTGEAPKLATLTTLISGRTYSRDGAVYATPLSTFAVTYTAKLLNNSDMLFGEALTEASETIQSAFGFGILDGIDLYTTAPILTDSGNHQQALEYRTAIEGFAAILLLITETSGLTTDQLLSMLASDLLDGGIDGLANGEVIDGLPSVEQLSTAIATNPALLNIPGTDQAISQLIDLIKQESTLIAPSVTAADLTAPQPVAALGGKTDTDGDGISDSLDQFPLNANEAKDSDSDCPVVSDSEQNEVTGNGCGDNSDWASEISDVQSACDPGALSEGNTGTVLTPDEKKTLGCSDSDEDGIKDIDDIFPLNKAEWADSDNDCPASETDPSQQSSTSGNNCGDNSDPTYCYSIEIEGQIPSVNIEGGAGTTHGLGFASFDSYQQIATIEAVQRAEVLLVAGFEGSRAADSTLNVEYFINFDKPNRNPDLTSASDRALGNSKRLSNCTRAALVPAADGGPLQVCPEVDGNGAIVPDTGLISSDAAYNAWTQAVTTDRGVFNNAQTIEFSTTLVVATFDVDVDYRMTKTSEFYGPGSCNIDVSNIRDDVLAIPQSFTLD
ncbi:hypothetical protein SIN8267_01491 [Sinobacterium norvegicum]|uniref:Uncharacterized protein n=1 Tax=Sinobacterium norvegicum TaxID=1641715 RepID=A0ABM9ADW2_9GAMM|nr:hypothetical protein [Sinobacterium norvegicum]CAH0991388.1 hypothetical protein SIN8267_01491 [Sinobacterium norvegicum]